MNRFWQMLFGVGLVKTTENFGVQTEYPRHPELLDWLAAEFIESGWDVKELIRTIVTSETYRRSSNHLILCRIRTGSRESVFGSRFAVSHAFLDDP